MEEKELNSMAEKHKPSKCRTIVTWVLLALFCVGYMIGFRWFSTTAAGGVVTLMDKVFNYTIPSLCLSMPIMALLFEFGILKLKKDYRIGTISTFIVVDLYFGALPCVLLILLLLVLSSVLVYMGIITYFPMNIVLLVGVLVPLILQNAKCVRRWLYQKGTSFWMNTHVPYNRNVLLSTIYFLYGVITLAVYLSEELGYELFDVSPYITSIVVYEIFYNASQYYKKFKKND